MCASRAKSKAKMAASIQAADACGDSPGSAMTLGQSCDSKARLS